MTSADWLAVGSVAVAIGPTVLGIVWVALSPSRTREGDEK